MATQSFKETLTMHDVLGSFAETMAVGMKHEFRVSNVVCTSRVEALERTHS